MNVWEKIIAQKSKQVIISYLISLETKKVERKILQGLLSKNDLFGNNMQKKAILKGIPECLFLCFGCHNNNRATKK